MTIDYDTSRPSSLGLAEPAPAIELDTPLAVADGTLADDVEDSELADYFELPGADLSGEELLVRVVPQQADEFVCASCFLIQSRHRLATRPDGRTVCRDCAS